MRQLKITPQITSRESLSLSKYLNEVSSISLSSQEEEVELARRIQEGDEEALETLVKSNLRFVISVAKQYQGQGEPLSDLVSSGNEGLIIAAKRFDHTRGFKFISYAVWWIRQSIMKYLTENGKSIRLPSNKVNLLKKIKAVIAKLEQVYQRTPTLDEVSEDLIAQGKDLTADDVETILLCYAPMTSLDSKISEDSDSSFLDSIQAETLMDINISLDQEDLESLLNKLFDRKLSPKEKEVLISYYGLFGNRAKTLEEIGDNCDLTRERVRQIKEKAIRKLKQKNSSRVIKEYV